MRKGLLLILLSFPVTIFPSEGVKLEESLPLYSVLPFIGILLSISFFPLFAPNFWHKRYPLISLLWGLIFVVPFILVYKSLAVTEVIKIFLFDYLPFLILLWGLFTVSGGIYFKGTLVGTPMFNTILLLIGTFLSSFMGTTGSAMLLIRPLLKANEKRKYKTHIFIFFIFLIANIGGCLTPIGDPPLFLGFLNGVPFLWTLRLFLPLLFVSTILLVLFFIIDYKFFKKENLYPILKKLTKKKRESIRVYGLNNFLLLILIVLSVIFSGYVKLGELNVLSININFQDLIRDVAIVIIGIVSLWTTKKEYRKENRFTFEPIKEVAILFGAIFITMIPALAILKAGANGHLGFLVGGIDKPIQYFWLSGLLSSILDNAPTYLTFLNMALGNFYSGTPEREAINLLIQNKGLFLEAISIGCVFMGANTYIGNAPNFMVKSIAEENGVKMPTFLGYIFKWSIPILMPLFFLLGVIFLRG